MRVKEKYVHIDYQKTKDFLNTEQKSFKKITHIP